MRLAELRRHVGEVQWWRSKSVPLGRYPWKPWGREGPDCCRESLHSPHYSLRIMPAQTPPPPPPPPPKSLLSHQYIKSFLKLFTLKVCCQKKFIEVKQTHILRCLFSMLFLHSGYYGTETWVFHRQVETRPLHDDVEIGGLVNTYKLSPKAVWISRVRIHGRQ